jgi:hypothetical protein
MILFWLLYGLAGLGFVVAWLDYFLPWSAQWAEASELERTQLKILLETPSIKATAGTLIFLVWPLLFIFIVLFCLYMVGVLLIELVRLGVVTVYTGLRWYWAKHKYRKHQMNQYKIVEKRAKATFKASVENALNDIIAEAKAKARDVK